jgi:hypothetical protein
MEHSRTRSVAAFAGIVLVVGFFLPWFDLGGLVAMSGFDLVTSGDVDLLTRILIALVPLAGLSLLASAATNHARTKSVAIVTGLGILGYTGYQTAKAFVQLTGYGLWAILGAAIVAIVVGLALPSKK